MAGENNFGLPYNNLLPMGINQTRYSFIMRMTPINNEVYPDNNRIKNERTTKAHKTWRVR
ncbi:MAG: hypothetical protein B6I19_04280 [Bacteroidetes bacterium 4572_114]|nr:MAG: hypothetical protein B6I19_04280 [Bacteroidetes bacterium 4572_114]